MKGKHRGLLLGQDVKGFEKLSFRRLGEPACSCMREEQLIGKYFERLL